MFVKINPREISKFHRYTSSIEIFSHKNFHYMLFGLNFWVDLGVNNLSCLQFVPEHKDGQFFQKISSPCRKKISYIMIVSAYNALKWGKRILSFQFIFVA